jgi:hypothetical protein
MADSSSAIGIMLAAKELLGDHHSWEPESVWLSLKERGIDLSEANRSKLMAAVALVYVPSFYWDGVVFEKTALALDGVVGNPDALEEATSAQLAWAVEEAGWIARINHLDTPVFQHEPSAYAAVVLHREGMVLAPRQLSFAQELLDEMNRRGDRDLKERVRERWDAMKGEGLAGHTYGEDPEGVQLARLAAVELHVQERDDAAGSEASRLT